MSESSSDEDINLTPAELLQAVHNDELSFLPEKSREKYIKAYNLFNAWRHSKGTKTFSETIMVSYFIELFKTRKSSTLWTIYSMLKATIKTKNDIHKEKYSKLLVFLKKKSSANITNIEKFLNEAPDSEFLVTKVVLIIGITGACRTNELTYLTTKNIEKQSEKLLLVNLSNTKTNIDRNFVIRDEYVKIVVKYQALRPTNTPINRFYFCNIVKDSMLHSLWEIVKLVVCHEKLPLSLDYRNQSNTPGIVLGGRRPTLLADSSADLSMLKLYGSWKSSIMAEGYIEDSIENRSKICKGIVGRSLKQSCPDPWTRPSTSKDRTIENRFESPANPSVSPTFTMESNDIEQCSENLPNNLSSNSTQVTNTSTTVPKKK